VTLERVVADLAERIERRYFGKYRGTVVDNEDPDCLGRLKLKVQCEFGRSVVTGWAAPCAPYGGAAGQGFLFVPDRGAGVWVEFENGELEFPVWTGTYWCAPGGTSQVPRPNAADGTEQDAVQNPPTRKIIKTAKGHTVQFEDADGEEAVLVREGTQGHLIRMDRDGIRIRDKNANTIELTADGIRITDSAGNAVEMTGSAVTLTVKAALTIDAAGQPVTVVCDSFDLKKG
jgi:uncharacterized protein involved in type VI secretion and phage assembly